MDLLRTSADFVGSVHYDMPHSVHIHKSMLLRGVNFAPATLDRADIEATKSKASSSGRSFGGVPFRGGRGNGRGRGGHISYANDRPNPFAAHINPGFAPPQSNTGPPPGHFQGYRPPPPPQGNGYYNGPPPPQNGYFNGQAPQGAYGQGGFYNGSSHPAPNGFPNQYGYPPGPPHDPRYYRGR